MGESEYSELEINFKYFIQPGKIIIIVDRQQITEEKESQQLKPSA